MKLKTISGLVLSIILAGVMFIHPVEAKTIKASKAHAICRDGTYSYSVNRRGTCSHHKGVKVWLW